MSLAVLQTFFALVKRDIAVFLPTWKDRFVNAIIWCVLTLLVFEHIMPTVGLKGFGVFMAVGTAASWGFFEVTENIARFVSDLEGDRSISYYLTLPMPQWAVFTRLAITNAIQAISISIMFLPISKILLWNQFSFAKMSLIKFSIIFLIIHLFYGFFSLFLAVRVQTLEKMGDVWMRIVYPLWWLGCFQFSWSTLHQLSPRIAYINLFNPLVYIMEGIRSSILGQEGFMPFWYCVGALLFFTGLIGFVGTKQLMRRLDCL